jgi:hypothetical protein
MNTRVLDYICRGEDYSHYFGGVYAIDEYYSRQPHFKDVCIVNTDSSNGPGEHWFVVDKTDIHPIIFDSYGELSPTTEKSYRSQFNVRDFNVETLQSFETNTCGDYAAFYVIMRCRQENSVDIINFLRNISSSNLLRDHIIRQSMKKYFEHRFLSDQSFPEHLHIDIQKEMSCKYFEDFQNKQ